MKTSGQCPACQGRLSLWAGMKSPTPFHIRCPHCRARCRVRMPGFWLVLAMLVLLSGGGMVGCLFAYRAYGMNGLLKGFAGFILLWLLLEVGVGIIFYSFATLTADAASKQRAKTTAADKK